MITDIGTKALASQRFEKFKELMNMRKLEVEHEEETEPTEDGEKKGRREVAKDGEKREPRKEESSTMGIEEVATVLNLISLAAVISIAEGREERLKRR